MNENKLISWLVNELDQMFARMDERVGDSMTDDQIKAILNGVDLEDYFIDWVADL